MRAASGALPLFASALRNADALAEAMESRCYEPYAPRTPFRRLTISFADGVIATAAVLVTAASLAFTAFT
jgi:energy-coupling factor transporter transmembrane protein EcfT